MIILIIIIIIIGYGCEDPERTDVNKSADMNSGVYANFYTQIEISIF